MNAEQALERYLFSHKQQIKKKTWLEIHEFNKYNKTKSITSHKNILKDYKKTLALLVKNRRYIGTPDNPYKNCFASDEIGRLYFTHKIKVLKIIIKCIKTALKHPKALKMAIIAHFEKVLRQIKAN